LASFRGTSDEQDQNNEKYGETGRHYSPPPLERIGETGQFTPLLPRQPQEACLGSGRGRNDVPRREKAKPGTHAGSVIQDSAHSDR
jgi:hypothetical protein